MTQYPDLISIHDTNFKVIKVNKALSAYLGKTSEEICGRYCYEIFHNSAHPHPDCPHNKALKHKEIVSEDLINPDSGETLKVTCTPLYDIEGKLKGTIHHAIPLSAPEKNPQTSDVDFGQSYEYLAICANCNNYRDENNEWKRIVSYLYEKTPIKLTHGICPDCAIKLYPDFLDD